MREGAFALIDCLGFKGIWKSADAASLLQKLLRIEHTVHDRVVSGAAEFNFLSYGPIRVHVRLLSDTVAISLQYEARDGEGPEDPQKNILVALVCDSVVKVLDLFLIEEPALVLRGCVTYGEHLSEGNFIVGPAVDDAAEYMDVAQGAFVWLHPTAAAKYRDFRKRPKLWVDLAPPGFLRLGLEQMKDPEGKFAWLRGLLNEHGEEAVMEKLLPLMSTILSAPIVIDPYNVPLKTGGLLQCPVVNPLAFQNSVETRQITRQLYSKVMSGKTLDVWLKHQNTMEFLEVAEHFSAEFEEKLAVLKSHRVTRDKQEQPSQQAPAQQVRIRKPAEPGSGLRFVRSSPVK